MLPILVVLAFGVVVYQLIRRPDLRRLAVRDAVRRRGETALVIVGSLLGTAIMTGSFIVGDTLDASIKALSTSQLGPVDELVVVPDVSKAAGIERQISGMHDPNIDGVTSLLRAPASLSARGPDGPLAEPSARLVELDFAVGEAFGGDPSATGLTGDTPQAGKVALTQDLADSLEVGVGDRVSASLFGKTRSLEVDRILAPRGLAGFWTDTGTSSPNAFVAPGTIEGLISGSLPPGAVPPSTTVVVSNDGDIEAGAALSGPVTDAIEKQLADPSLTVETVKQDALDFAKTQGDQFSKLFFSIGSFAVIAGILLLVQIFVMLSEERKGQLGMLRAVGMRRSDLVRSFYMQGGLYALPAGALGALLGIGVGWAIIRVAAPIFGGSGDFSLALTFSLQPMSLITGFCIGALISLVTVFLTSVRISRINIIRAIRDLPEPPRLKAKLRTLIIGVVVALLGAVLFVSGLSSSSAWAGVLLGPPMVLFGLLPTMGRFFPRRPAVIFVAAASLAWAVLADTVTGGKAFGGGDISAFVLQGVLLNVSAVVLLSQVQENLGGLLRKFAARSLPLRLGLSYPLARRFRTGLTLGMFSLVIFTMVFISVLSNVFGGQVENTLRKEAGSYDIIADSLPSDPPAADKLRIPGVEVVSAALYGTARFTLADGTEDVWPVTGVDGSFLTATPPDLEETAPGLGSDLDVWKKIISDPTVAAVPKFFLQQGGGGPSAQLVQLGDTVKMADPVTGKSSERKIIAFTGSQDFQTLSSYMSYGGVGKVLGNEVAPSRFYIDVSGTPADASAIATRLQGQFIANGVKAKTFRSIVDESQAGSMQFLRLMQGYLALGLLVGIAGIGVVMVRAVRERRREVGVLRSLGFMPSMVRRAFILESAFTAFEGILVGTVLALITAHQLIANGDFGDGIVFTIPWLDIAILLLVSLAASLVATWWPAHQASQIPPAVALRIAD